VESSVFVTPVPRSVWERVSRRVVIESAGQLTASLMECRFPTCGVCKADVAFTRGTRCWVVPVSRANGIPTAGGVPRTITKCLSDVWIEAAGLGFVAWPYVMAARVDTAVLQ
jgi:hypothetical protein